MYDDAVPRLERPPATAACVLRSAPPLRVGGFVAVDVLACPECGGRLRLLATIAQRAVIEKILSHLGLPRQPVLLAPAALEADLFGGVAGYIH